MGEQVTQGGESIWGGNYEEDSARNEAKKNKEQWAWCVMYMCVGIGDVLLAMAIGSDDECRKTSVRRVMRNTMRIR